MNLDGVVSKIFEDLTSLQQQVVVMKNTVLDFHSQCETLKKENAALKQELNHKEGNDEPT